MSRDKTTRRPTDGEACRSRRGVIAAAAGAVGVVAAETLARATPAQAANGDPVLQGTNNGPTTAPTFVFNSDGSNASFASGFGVAGTAAGNGAAGVMGSGVNAAAGVSGLGG